VLARPGARAPELFLGQRRSGPAFGASYVFPGGLLEGGDCDAAAFSDLPAEVANSGLGLDAGGLDYYCAAIRETFEETGVLLARGPHGAGLPSREVLEAARRRLNEGERRWSDFLREQRLVLACDALHYFAWWVTPRTLPRRFSTRFFLAALPEGQEASHDGRELTGSRWMTAGAALAAADEGVLTLPPPTRATLADLARSADLEALLDWARRRTAAGVPRIQPVIERREGRDRVLMPWDPDYPADAGGDET
jgi:8-oxo-dGTP pyrophosphatase MutT (NUDIX family)